MNLISGNHFERTDEIILTRMEASDEHYEVESCIPQNFFLLIKARLYICPAMINITNTTIKTIKVFLRGKA